MKTQKRWQLRADQSLCKQQYVMHPKGPFKPAKPICIGFLGYFHYKNHSSQLPSGFQKLILKRINKKLNWKRNCFFFNFLWLDILQVNQKVITRFLKCTFITYAGLRFKSYSLNLLIYFIQQALCKVSHKITYEFQCFFIRNIQYCLSGLNILRGP